MEKKMETTIDKSIYLNALDSKRFVCPVEMLEPDFGCRATTVESFG